VHNLGFGSVSDDVSPSCEEPSLYAVLAALEQQLSVLDALGERVAAAHVSAAVEYLRLGVLQDKTFPDTRH
jgi:hypothetical protein